MRGNEKKKSNDCKRGGEGRGGIERKSERIWDNLIFGSF
jgi:hypothetical protein